MKQKYIILCHLDSSNNICYLKIKIIFFLSIFPVKQKFQSHFVHCWFSMAVSACPKLPISSRSINHYRNLSWVSSDRWVDSWHSCSDAFLQLCYRWNVLFVQAMNPFKPVTWHEIKKFASHEQDALSSLFNFWRHADTGEVVYLWHSAGILIDTVRVLLMHQTVRHPAVPNRSVTLNLPWRHARSIIFLCCCLHWLW